jgi:hypothetical protein
VRRREFTGEQPQYNYDQAADQADIFVSLGSARRRPLRSSLGHMPKRGMPPCLSGRLPTRIGMALHWDVAVAVPSRALLPLRTVPGRRPLPTSRDDGADPRLLAPHLPPQGAAPEEQDAFGAAAAAPTYAPPAAAAPVAAPAAAPSLSASSSNGGPSAESNPLAAFNAKFRCVSHAV